MKPFIFIVLFYFACFSIQGQITELDSLKSIQQTAQHDSQRSEALIQLGVLYWETYPDSSIYFAHQALDYANHIGDSLRQASALKTIGVGYDYKGNMDSCLSYLFRARAIFKKLRRIDKESHTLSDIATAWMNRGNYELALRNHLNALTLRKQFGNKKFIAISYNNIGLLYRSRKDYPKAITYYQQSLDIKNELNDERGKLNTYINLGSAYHASRQYHQALHFGQEARKLAITLQKINDQSAAEINMTSALIELGRIQEALPLIKQVEEKVLQSSKDNNILITVYENYGDAYFRQQLYKEASLSYGQGLLIAQKVGRGEAKELFSRKLARTYAKLGLFKEAYEYQQNSRELQDSLFNAESSRQAQELATVYETAEKEKQIQHLGLEKNIAIEETNQKKKENVILYIGIALFSALSFLLFKALRSNRSKTLLLTQQNIVIEQALEEKEFLIKEIHHRVKNNLQIISSLLSLQSNYITDESALEAVQDSKNRVHSMGLVHQGLYTEENVTQVKVDDYFNKLIDNLEHSYGLETRRIVIRKEIIKSSLDVDTIVPLGLILNELITNAIKYAFEGRSSGLIDIRLAEDNEFIRLKVSDNGVGMTTTNPLNLQKSFGTKMIDAFLKKLKGAMHIQNELGTCIEIVFPKK